MALFDKLKEIKKTIIEVKEGIEKGIKMDMMSPEERQAFRQAEAEKKGNALIAELPDETTLTYELCDSFELAEIKEIPGKYRITDYVGFGIKGNIEIPAVINGKEVYAIGKKLFQKNQEIKYIKLAEGIKVIERDAFHESSILGIVLPETLEKISFRAFAESKLKRISIPDQVAFIGRACFCRCKDLLSVKLPASKKTLPDYLFYSCTNLVNVTIPDNLVSVGHDACVPCATIPETLELLGANGLNLPYVDEFHFPEKLRTVDGKMFKSINCRKLFIPADLQFTAYSTIYELKDRPENDNAEFDTKETILYGTDSQFCDKFVFEKSKYEEVVFEPGCTYYLGSYFKNCENLKKLYIPSSMTKFDDRDGLFGVNQTNEYFVATKDIYGRNVYDHDGTQMGEYKGNYSRTVLSPANREFVLYCEAGSEALKFARKFDLKYAEWKI